MAKKTKKKQKARGIVKIPKRSKFCWISKEDRNGWSLGFALSKKTLWIRGLRFSTKEEVDRAMESNIIFVLLKNSVHLGKY